jgi:hypothetical protein
MWANIVSEVTDAQLETAYEEIKNYLSKVLQQS